MPQSITKEIGRLRSLAEERGAIAKRISVDDIVIREWVRFKCRYGCKGYGKHFSCPPYSPTPSETRSMVTEYETALLLRFDGVPGHETIDSDEIPEDFHPWYRDLILWVNDTVHFVEKTAFYDGYYKAFGFSAYPCIYCVDCIPELRDGIVDESLRRFCKHLDRVRPSMEGSGIDVFATAKNVGWDISTIPCKDMEYGKIIHGNLRSVGLVLIE